MSDIDSQVEKQKRGVFRFIFSIAKAVFWGLTIGLFINCIFWHFEGYRRLMLNLNNTYQVQMGGISYRNKQSAIGIGEFDAFLIDLVHKSESEMKHATSTNKHIGVMNVEQHSAGILAEISSSIGHFIMVLTKTFDVLIAKFFSVFISIWVFVFAGILGAMDGLLARYIRTIEGGRESTFIFHRVSDTVIKVPVAIIFFYLSIPVFINPEVLVVVISALFFLFFYVATANLKKFL